MSNKKYILALLMNGYISMEYNKIINHPEISLERKVQRIQSQFFNDEIDDLKDSYYDLLSIFYSPQEKETIANLFMAIPLIQVIKKFHKQELTEQEAIGKMQDCFIGNPKMNINIYIEYIGHISNSWNCYKATQKETITELLIKQNNQNQ